ncbi:MAG: hypothetical protein U1F45_18795 [Burkholderiales bacterium]
MAIDGNFAFVHVRYLNWGGKEHAGVDIFRFNDQGKIVEHWDVLQAVAETAANSNTMPEPQMTPNSRLQRTALALRARPAVMRLCYSHRQRLSYERPTQTEQADRDQLL